MMTMMINNRRVVCWQVHRALLCLAWQLTGLKRNSTDATLCCMPKIWRKGTQATTWRMLWLICSLGGTCVKIEYNMSCVTMLLRRSRRSELQTCHTLVVWPVLQLAVKHALEAHEGVENVIALGQRIVGHFKHSTIWWNSRKCINSPEHRLIQDEQTRWNSTFYMLVCLKEQRRALTSYGGQYDITLSTVSQWDLTDKAIYHSSAHWG